MSKKRNPISRPRSRWSRATSRLCDYRSASTRRSPTKSSFRGCATRRRVGPTTVKLGSFSVRSCNLASESRPYARPWRSFPTMPPPTTTSPGISSRPTAPTRRFHSPPKPRSSLPGVPSSSTPTRPPFLPWVAAPTPFASSCEPSTTSRNSNATRPTPAPSPRRSNAIARRAAPPPASRHLDHAAALVGWSKRGSEVAKELLPRRVPQRRLLELSQKLARAVALAEVEGRSERRGQLLQRGGDGHRIFFHVDDGHVAKAAALAAAEVQRGNAVHG